MTSDTATVADGLLAALRTATRTGDLAFARRPEQIPGGMDTRIFAFELAGAASPLAGPLILRLFDPADDPLRARWEAAVQNAVAGQGFPAPEVLVVNGEENALGAPFVVMRRLPGKPMLGEATFGRILPQMIRFVTRYPAVLASLQASLHSLDAGRFMRELEEAGLAGSAPEAGVSRRVPTLDGQLTRLQGQIDGLRLDGLRPGLGWLLQNHPGEPDRLAICHGDFHPINVLMQDDRVTGVIDWPNTTVADPAFDVANTRLLLAIAPVELPALADPAVGMVRRLVVRMYSTAYAGDRPFNAGAVTYFEALRCLVELAWVGERRRTGAGMYRNPWGSARSVRKLITHFQRSTGVAAEL